MLGRTLQNGFTKLVDRAGFRTPDRCFFHNFYSFFKLASALTVVIYAKDSFRGLMCPVLHMERCTNVATFEILPLHSEVVRGW